MWKDHDVTIIIRDLLPALRPYLWRIVLSLVVTGLVIGVDLFQPYGLKQLLDAATLTSDYQAVILMLCLLLGLAGLRAFLHYWDIYIRSTVGEAISAHYRRRVFEHILHLPFATLHEMERGSLIHRIMHDCGEIGRVYVSTELLPMIAKGIQVLALLVLILILNWHIGLASILVFPVGWLISRQMTRHSQAQVIQLRTQVEQGHEQLHEVFSCIKEVRAVGNEAGEMRRWDQWLQAYGKVVCATTTEHQFLRVAFSRMVDWIGLCVVFGWGGWQLLAHQISVGTLLALALYVQQLYTTLATMLSGRLEMREVANALEALNAILQLEREWPDQGQNDLKDGSGHLEFVQVGLSYKNSAEALRGVSFHNAPGQVLGIVGPSGSGKSTLIHACLRFYPITEGAILLDGQDITEIAPHVLRQQIGLVSQDIHLWNTTIHANLVYGLPHEVSEEQLRKVCEMTRVHAFVQQLPQGYETIVGANGVKLSGGEKQRLSLARALLRDTKILLLDEATSALDSLTESAIVTLLNQAFQTKNRIVVAHRLATVQKADQIIVLEKGRIVETGPPAHLSQQNGLYAALYQTQKLGLETGS